MGLPRHVDMLVLISHLAEQATACNTESKPQARTSKPLGPPRPGWPVWPDSLSGEP